jgi:hypothetical protein
VEKDDPSAWEIADQVRYDGKKKKGSHSKLEDSKKDY